MASDTSVSLEGTVYEWDLGGDLPKRRYAVFTLSYGEARKLFVPQPYDPEKRTGEQRHIILPHARKLKNEIKLALPSASA
jgi:hypothetical protein